MHVQLIYIFQIIRTQKDIVNTKVAKHRIQKNKSRPCGTKKKLLNINSHFFFPFYSQFESFNLYFTAIIGIFSAVETPLIPGSGGQ